ncbi:MAG: 50S ribosomal protein L10, partial [Peptoniphilaceae bacterium]|nr:50S ribosomal protein L10 [Peptoniphilaceae bacterium]
NYKVYKNTMMKFAFKELGFDQFDDLLNGPNALIFSTEDLVSGPKVTEDFITENDANKEKIEIKGGIVENEFLDGEKMVAISKLPSKEVLLTQLVYTLQAPIRKLVQDSNQIIAKLVYALDAVREKKENEVA